MSRRRKPAHGFVSTRVDLVSHGESRGEIEAVVRLELHWEDVHVQSAPDGLVDELR